MKGYLLDQKDGCHYSFTVGENDPNIAKLFFARIGQWTSNFKGKRALRLVDTGNDYVFTFKSGKKVTLDICELAELRKICDLYFKNKEHTFTSYQEVKI